MMSVVYFLSGVIFHTVMVLVFLIPIAIDVGSVCIKKGKLAWDIDPDELEDALDQEYE